ncbi:MAG TPA: ANTAR domain-containing protein [Firmicutes bacterium]|nr:ANTAR domain-containing protein [Bacillota bacterium]
MRRREVFIADKSASSRQRLRRILTEAGYAVVGEAGDGSSALRGIRSLEPEVVVLDSDLPALNGFEVARIVEEDHLAPVVLIASQTSWEFVEKAKESSVSAYLVRPVSERDLIPAIELAIANYERRSRLQEKIRELEESLESRKVIERAKGVLMKTMGLSESEAYRLIQKQAMDKSTSMRAIAEAVLLTYELKKKGRGG